MHRGEDDEDKPASRCMNESSCVLNVCKTCSYSTAAVDLNLSMTMGEVVCLTLPTEPCTMPACSRLLDLATTDVAAGSALCVD
jgi:hypothetical protein